MTSLNIHRIIEVEARKSNESDTSWLSIILTDDRGHEFDITMFSNKKELVENLYEAINRAALAATPPVPAYPADHPVEGDLGSVPL